MIGIVEVTLQEDVKVDGASPQNMAGIVTDAQLTLAQLVFTLYTACGAKQTQQQAGQGGTTPASAQTFSVGSRPYSIAIDGAGNVWVTNLLSNNVTKLQPDGTVAGTFQVGREPYGIAIDKQGNVWVTLFGANQVLKLANIADLFPPVVATPLSLTFLGLGSGNAQTFTASQTGFSGAFTIIDTNCIGTDGSTVVATVSPTSASDGVFTVTPQALGSCTITVNGSASTAAGFDVSVIPAI